MQNLSGALCIKKGVFKLLQRFIKIRYIIAIKKWENSLIKTSTDPRTIPQRRSEALALTILYKS